MALRVLAMVLAGFLALGCGSSNGGSGGGGGGADASGADAGADGDVADASNVSDASDAGSVDAGRPVALVPQDALDFGFSDCGGTPPGQKTLTIKNTGEGRLTWSASLASTTVFFLIGPSSGTLTAGKSATITISALGMPSASLPGAVLETTLSITTNDPAHAKTDLRVTATAGGGVLTLVPQTAAFGVVGVGRQATDIALALTNNGNRPVTLNFEDPTDAQYALTWTGAPQEVVVAPGASVPGLRARFLPSTTAATTTSARIVLVSGGLCGANPSSIAMSGQGSLGVFGYQPAVIDFGNVGCGKTSTLPLAQRTVTISNTGGASFTFSATLAGGAASPYTIAIAGSPVAPGGTGTIVVTPKSVPTASAITPNLYGDTITIASNIPNDVPHLVDVRETASGAIFAFLPATPLAFGDVPVNTTATSGFSVANVGNAPATVTASVTGGPAFSLATTALGSIAGSASVADTAIFAPTTSTAYAGTLSLALAAGDLRCAPLPTLPLAGNGSTSVVSLSASALDFGYVDCGARGVAKTITLRNTGATAFSWSATLASGTSFAIALANTTLAAAGQPGDTGTITVTPNAIPGASAVTADLYGDLLTVTTTAAGDNAHTVALHMTARGAILTASTNDISFGGVAAGSTATSPLTLSNTGNVAASVALTSTASAFAWAPPSGAVAGGSTSVVVASFAPTATSAYSASGGIAVQQGTPLCAPLPSAVALSGVGTSGAAVITPTSLDYGRVTCGTQTQDQSILIANNGTAPFTFTAQLTSGASFYTLGATSGSVDPGLSFTLVVTPVLVPATSLTTADLYAGRVTITTSAPGDAPHAVSLHETAFGARFSVSVSSLAFGTVRVGGSRALFFTMTNSGNAGADIAYMGFQTPPFTAAPDLFRMEGQTSTSVAVTFSPTQPGAVAGQSLAIQSTDPMCLPLPAAITLSGSGL